MTNANLTSAQVVPGFFGYIDYNSGGAGLGPNLRCLLWGIRKPTGQRTPNMPFLCTSQQEADDGSGAASDLACTFRHVVAQPESQGAEIWLLPLDEPAAGVASQYKLKVFGPATKSGVLKLWIDSMPIPDVGFSAGDSASTIATALRDALNTMGSKLPIGTCTLSTDTVTIPYVHKGVTGEDLPIRARITDGAGVKLSPGTITLATNATGAGSVKVEFGALAVSIALAGGETPAAVATLIAASFNADSYPLTAQASASTVDLFMVNDKDVRRIKASVITSTGLTANLGSGVTDGAGSPTSFTYNGTLGVGIPSFSAALANLLQLEAFRSWASPWNDATSLGTMANHIETAADGSISGQKQQLLTVCGYSALSVDGAVPAAVAPNLTTTAPRYAYLWAPDAPVKGIALAAKAAAARAATWIDNPKKNWNGFKFKGSSESAPVLLPPTKPSLSSCNTALRTYGLAPVVRGASGYLELMKGRTTSLAPDKRLWAWSAESQAAFHFYDTAQRLQERFEGGSIVRQSEPKAEGLFDNASVIAAGRELMRDWEREGHYDGAEVLSDAVKSTIDVNNPSRFNLKIPESPVVDLDQIVFELNYQSPTA